MIEYTNSQMERLIDEIIHSSRNRELLKDRLINGFTFERLSEKYELSVQHVKYIVYRERERLFKGL